MPPKKQKHGVEHLVGKVVWLESIYDKDRIEGLLVSVDSHFLGLDVAGRVIYFNIDCIHGLAEEVKEP